MVRVKAALRRHRTGAVARIPDLRFSVDGVYQGVDTIVIPYRNRDGAIVEGYGPYFADK